MFFLTVMAQWLMLFVSLFQMRTIYRAGSLPRMMGIRSKSRSILSYFDRCLWSCRNSKNSRSDSCASPMSASFSPRVKAGLLSLGVVLIKVRGSTTVQAVGFITVKAGIVESLNDHSNLFRFVRQMRNKWCLDSHSSLVVVGAAGSCRKLFY